MGKMRTMAFQVPEDLFQKIKDYLNRNHMTQKDFVLGLITKEIDGDLAARQEATQRDVTADEQDTEEYGEQDDDELSEDSDEDFEEDKYDEYDEDEDEDYDDEEDEDADYNEDEDGGLDEAEDEAADEEADEVEDTAEAEEPVME